MKTSEGLPLCFSNRTMVKCGGSAGQSPGSEMCYFPACWGLASPLSLAVYPSGTHAGTMVPFTMSSTFGDVAFEGTISFLYSGQSAIRSRSSSFVSKRLILLNQDEETCDSVDIVFM